MPALAAETTSSRQTNEIEELTPTFGEVVRGIGS
jgi:hypothetical protein